MIINKNIAKLAYESGFDISEDGKFGNYSQIIKVNNFAKSLLRIIISDLRHTDWASYIDNSITDPNAVAISAAEDFEVFFETI